MQVTPETHVRANQGDSILFRIPENQLREEGLKRKMRLMQYNLYKERLRAEAFKAGFVIPTWFFQVTFYIPCSPSWPAWKKELLHLQPHLFKPDADNLQKALFDALKRNDETIWHYEPKKLWINKPTGYIKIRF